VQVAYWAIVHPVNRVWAADISLSPASARFFAAGRGDAPAADPDWRRLRDRWERGHAIRAALAGAALLALLAGRG
jgi:hypothetical protein